jgi:hypothetical protein
MEPLTFKQKMTVVSRAVWLAASYSYEVLDSPIYKDDYYDKFIVPAAQNVSNIYCGFYDDFFAGLELAKSGMEVPRDDLTLDGFTKECIKEGEKDSNGFIHPPTWIRLIKNFYNIDVSH